MRRVESESRQPGMRATRQWRGPPALSKEARAIGEVRRREREEMERADRQIENLEALIKKLTRKTR